MTIRPRRSALYLPALNARAVAKARELPCDVVILDLEDAVAPEAKLAARAAALAAIREGGFGTRELVIRANALSSDWGADDCAALAAARPDAVLLPKVDDGAAVAAYAALLPGVALWAMVETPRALLRLESLAGGPQLEALVMGTNDIAKDLGMRAGPDRLPFLGFLAQSVAAARAYGLVILDGVYNAIDDVEGFARECAQGVLFGFDGKTVIHPSQVVPCNAAFSPADEEIAWAATVERAFAAPEAAGRGAIRVEGRMVERLHLDQARRTLAIATAIGQARGHTGEQA